MNEEDLLKGIVYSEFDNHVGPVIRFIHPDMILNKEYIEVISDYIVLEKHLCNEIIRLSVGNLNFLLMCMNIDNPKYERNSFTFSFGLVMSEKSLCQEIDLQVYHRFLRNLTTFFYDLELESEFLSQSATKLKLFEILKLVFENFQLNHSCFLTIESGRIGLSKSKDPSSSLAKYSTNFYLPLQLFTYPELSQQINDYDVPLFRCDKIQLSQLTYDLSFRHIALYIDGISHVKKIAKDVNMDLHFVKKAISLLLFYNLIIVGDVFRFSNIYVYQPSRLLYPTLLKEVRDFACLESSVAVGPGSVSLLPKLSIRAFLLALQPRVDVGQALISCLTNGGHVEDLAEESDYSFENVNLQRLIAICLHKRIVKRLHEYPVFVKPNTGPSLTENVSDFFEEKAAMPAINEENSENLPSRTPRKTAFSQNISSTLDGRTFNKITSKAKSVVGQSYLRDSAAPDLNDLIQSLDGTEHLDSICCRYEVPFRTIVNAGDPSLKFGPILFYKAFAGNHDVSIQSNR